MVIDFDELKENTDAAYKNVRRKNNVKNFNDFFNAAALETFAHIIEKARAGSTMSIIELFKHYKITAKIKNFKDLSDVDNIDGGSIDAKMKQLEFKLKNLKFDKLTVASVTDAWLDGQISKAEHNILMNMIKQQTYATRERELQSDIMVELSSDLENSLKDDDV